MKIWKVNKDKINNIWLLTEDEEDYKINSFLIEGERMIDEWDSSLELYVYKKTTDYSDLPFFQDDLFVVNEKALSVFMEIVPNEIECLDFILRDATEKYKIVNPIDVVDCVDMEKSEYKVYKGNHNKIQFFKKICLKKEMLQDKHFFRVARCDSCLFLCSDKFKTAVENSGIKGLYFELFTEV